MKIIRIGTRKSQLALKQAHTVGQLLESNGYDYSIVEIDSKGDLDLTTPLYQLGITGVFTKALDVALLENQIDIAVHSLKDVPTALPKDIVQVAVLERDNYNDILAIKGADRLDFESELTIATGSIRRKAQWLNRYPHHYISGLRGNVNTRLQKLANNDWNGAIFSGAGLERIGLIPENHIVLDWMVPAPAQGVVTITALERDNALCKVISQLNHQDTETTSTVEREFLNELEGGCSAPIGAFATITEDILVFRGVLTSVDGENQVEIKRQCQVSNVQGFGRLCAREILRDGGKEIMDHIKNS